MGCELVKQDETSLIEEISKGDRASFDQLVNLYRDKGISIAYNIVGNLEDAKDVLQEVFVKVYLNIKSFRRESKFSTWFYRIVVNSSLDFLRQRKKLTKVWTESLSDEEGRQLEVEDLRFEPAKMLINQELSGKLDSCIEILTEKQRVCFTLKYRNGLTSSEIAGILKCANSTVKVHLFRAVRVLQDKLAAYIAV